MWRRGGRRRGVVGLVLGLLAAGVSLVLLAPPASAQSAGPFPQLSANELVAFLNAASLPGTSPSPGVQPITGDGAADARIVWRAVSTDYKLRPLSAVGLSNAAGVALNPEATDALLRMRGAAGAAGAPFVVVSGHRSVGDQRGIFLNELAAGGRQRIGRAYSNAEIASGAADAAIDDVLRLNSIPGFSLHHTGDAVDLVAPGGSLGSFAGSAAYRWLSADNYANAKAFGFVPSYPVGATAIGPDPEPWEFTYVGVTQIQCANNVVLLADRSPGRCPVGSLDGVTVQGSRVTVGGWAADADAPGSATEVHVYADNRGVAAVRADQFRPDVDAATGLGPSHGFSAAVDLPPGLHVLCAYALNDVGGEPNTLLGCRLALVTTTPPVGALDAVTPVGNGVTLAGWSADPDVPAAALEVHVYVDGRGAAVLRADGPRPDVAAATGLGAGHGFLAHVPVPTGVHEVCAYGISPQPGEGNRLLGCRRVWSLGSTPTGVVDRVESDGRAVVVDGWAVDGDLPATALDVHVYVDGRGVAVRADQLRPDVGAAFSVGPAHGFRARVPASVGRHTACAYAIAAQPGDPNTLLGCRTVTVAGRPPVGVLDAAVGGAGRIDLAGWAADPDLPSVPVDVHVYVDGRGVAMLRADGSRPDVGAATAFGPQHGFAASVGSLPGAHTVCAYAITAEPGESNALIGCRSVSVS